MGPLKMVLSYIIHCYIYLVLVKFCCINFNWFTSGNTSCISPFHNRFNFFFRLFSLNYLCIQNLISVVFKDKFICVITESIPLFGCPCWNLSSMFVLFLSALWFNKKLGLSLSVCQTFYRMKMLPEETFFSFVNAQQKHSQALKRQIAILILIRWDSPRSHSNMY